MKKRLTLKLLITMAVLAYTVLSMVIIYTVFNCPMSYNGTYVFINSRGRFEAVVEFSPDYNGVLGDINIDGNKDLSKKNNTTGKLIADVINHTTCSCNNYGLRPDMQESTPSSRCQMVPPNLVGRLNFSMDIRSQDVFNKTALDLLKPGGFYKSTGCIARERVAILIPYRDRVRHLKMLLFHLHTFLQRQELEYGIFVIEMAFPTQFNRGLLANVGFLNARELMNFTCYIIHDVDQLPANDLNLYRCSNNPRHLSVSNSKYNFRLPYGHYIGGTVAFTPEQFIRINGFSNSFFGWGKEDDDLYRRILAAKYNIERPPADIGVYLEVPHHRDASNAANPMREGLFLTGHGRFKKDGLNSVLYNRLAMEYRPLFTWIYVNTSEVLILQRLQHIYAKISEDIRNNPSD